MLQGTIEEGIHQIAMEKLKLEQDVTGEEQGEGAKKKNVARLLKVSGVKPGVRRGRISLTQILTWGGGHTQLILRNLFLVFIILAL